MVHVSIVSGLCVVTAVWCVIKDKEKQQEASKSGHTEVVEWRIRRAEGWLNAPSSEANIPCVSGQWLWVSVWWQFFSALLK